VEVSEGRGRGADKGKTGSGGKRREGQGG